jgi:hypothetical protein
MKSLVVSAFLALCAAAPASAQKMGSTNANAPRCTTSITAGGMTVEIAFTSITMAAGKTMEQINSEKGEATRTRINASAEKNPLAELKTSSDITVGGKAVKAGTYAMFFTIDEKMKWHLNLASKDGKIDWTLDLKDAPEMKRLHIILGAGDEDGTAKLTIGFGKKICHVAVAGGAAGGKEEKGGH